MLLFFWGGGGERACLQKGRTNSRTTVYLSLSHTHTHNAVTVWPCSTRDLWPTPVTQPVCTGKSEFMRGGGGGGQMVTCIHVSVLTPAQAKRNRCLGVGTSKLSFCLQPVAVILMSSNKNVEEGAYFRAMIWSISFKKTDGLFKFS